MRKTTGKHNPLFNPDENALDFGDEFNPKELTDEEKVDSFMSKYMNVINPVGKYKKYFDSSAKGTDHILRDVKLYFKKLVIEGNWSERKYVEVIDDIFTNRAVISIVTLDRAGLMYDQGKLKSQRTVRGRGNRRQR